MGAPLTRELCAQGDEVVAVFRSNAQRAAQLRRETGCLLWQCDMGIEAEVEALFARFRFDSVVHLAGWNRNALFVQTSPAQWNDTLNSHLTSSFLLCRAGLQHLPRGGQMLLVSSRVGLRGNAGQSAYAAAKAGLFGLMRAAALEGEERGIRVNALCPGFAPKSAGVLSVQQQALRAREELLPDNDAAQSFAAFTSWFLRSNLKANGQILRPDCRI